MFKLYCRIFQNSLRGASYFLPWYKPELLKGQGSINQLPEVIAKKGIRSVLIVTDQGIASLGLMDALLERLSQGAIRYTIYDKTVPNPTIDNIEEALALYKQNKCEAMIAFGGGSSMDCAKGIGARLVRPQKRIPQLKGLLKVRKRMPYLFAVPTTSGTGSETTIAAVITDSRTHEKYAINDMALIPQVAVLDPLLTMKLTKHMTATTGMDALTHAVEAYIGKSNTKETRTYSQKAISLIFSNLQEVYDHGENIVARENMLMASHYAGIAFTRAYVGYVHAIAHALGGLYSIPHGLANAVILPYVLDSYGASVYKPLAELADIIGITALDDKQSDKAAKFIKAIRDLNRNMNIPEHLQGILDKDLGLIAHRAHKEANPLYPVPKILLEEDLMMIVERVKED